MNSPYGECPDCGGALFPRWFKEHEFVEGRFTGRVRVAVDVLVCTQCMRQVTVDDSFDGPWEWRNKK